MIFHENPLVYSSFMVKSLSTPQKNGQNIRRRLQRLSTTPGWSQWRCFRPGFDLALGAWMLLADEKPWENDRDFASECLMGKSPAKSLSFPGVWESHQLNQLNPYQKHHQNLVPWKFDDLLEGLNNQLVNQVLLSWGFTKCSKNANKKLRILPLK